MKLNIQMDRFFSVTSAPACAGMTARAQCVMLDIKMNKQEE
ncbi:MAG: hypothetical protein WC975_04360 [Phycisphaerae bacterium]